VTGPVTVVIPVYGRWPLTWRCLDALFAAELPEGTRVLVVDDASPDDTAARLAAYPGVEVLAHAQQTGFGQACNDGVAAARTPWVCLLNNDTEPRPGWLAALTGDAAAHPGTAAVGARLLYPDGTVQHADVVIGRDLQPHHAYAGFPGNHPAVMRSRDMQVVTAACVLLHRETFLDAGGFDAGFRNGHEDVDLCLRMRAAGRRVRYCAEAVVVHLESATRGRRTTESADNGRRYLRLWAGTVRPDDLETYAADGLLELSYDGDGTPLRLAIDPRLAGVGAAGRTGELEVLLRERSRQVAELLVDTISLTLAVAPRQVPAARRPAEATTPAADDTVQVALIALQRALAERLPVYTPGGGAEYRELVRRVRSSVTDLVPAGSSVAVLSRGHDDLLVLGELSAEHFPADDSGRYLGYHPAGGAEAVRLLDAARGRGVTHLVVPSPELWWLDYYAELAAELGSCPAGDPGTALVYELARTGALR